MAYGDILEINGQLVEHTPVGYMPVSPERAKGMMAKPAPTTKTTAPTQTLPTGTPTTDPNKAPAGETGGFDPNGGPTGGVTEETGTDAPAPAPETGGIKPMRDVKDEPETPAEMTFTFFEGAERGDASPTSLYGSREAEQVTEAELREYFEGDTVNRLPEVFGDFDNYLAYMTEREQLIQSGDYDTGNWDEYTGSLSEDDLMILEGEDLTQYGDDANMTYEELYGSRTQNQKAAYENWVNSEANQALLKKYGVSDTVYSETGDKFRWNGSAYVKTNEIDNSVNIIEIGKLGLAIALSVVATPAIASALAPGATAGSAAAVAANAKAASIMNLATQLLTTGQIDPEGALQSAATSFLSSTVMNSLRESNVFGRVGDAVRSSTTDQLLSANGDVLGQVVRDGAGNIIKATGVDPGVWAALASETGAIIQEGQGIVQQIASVLPEVPQWVYDATKATVKAVDAVFNSVRTPGAGANASGDLNFEPADATFIRQLQEAIEREEDPEVREALEEELNRYEEETVEEDILEDTTQEATGFEDDEPGITEEMFNDIVGQIREDNQVETQEIIDALAALNVTDLPTLSQIEEAFPELNDVSLTQIQNTVSTLLSDAGLLTTEEFSEAMAEVLTPEQLATALANLPYGDAEDFIEAVANAGYSTPEDIATALNDADLMSNEDFGTYMEQFREDVVGDVGTLLEEAIENFPFPDTFTDAQVEQLRETIVIPEGATMAQVQEALDRLAEQMPAEAPTLQEMSTLLNTALDGLNIASPEDVRTALSEFNFSEEQLTQIINALPEGLNISDLSTALEDVVVGEDLDAAVDTIKETIGNLSIASPDDVRDILTNYGFTEAQLAQIEGAVTIPPSATIADVQRIVDSIPEGLTAEQVATQLSGEFEGLTKDIAGVQSGIDELAESLGLSTDGLLTAISNLSGADGENLTTLQENILAGLGDISEEFGTDISGVVESVTDLTTDVADGIEGLGDQLTGIGEGIGGVQSGIDDLAENLGLSTDALILAISNLGTATGEDLTGLETSVLTGLGDLADNLGLNIGDVVDSVTDLETGLTENITGLSDQLTGVEEAVGGVTTAVTEGVESLADALGVQTDDIEAAIVTLGSGLGGELTDLETNVLLGLTGLADSIGTDVGTVVDSIAGLGTGLGENIQGLSEGLSEQLGTGFEGIGGQLESGFGQLGQQLGLATLGLFGLGAKQPTAQEIAAAQREFKYTPFEEKATPRQVQQVVRSTPVKQQPSALQQINQMIDRQTTTPQIQPMNLGMFTSDPNRKLA